MSRQKLHFDGDPADVDGITQKAVTVCSSSLFMSSVCKMRSYCAM